MCMFASSPSGPCKSSIMDGTFVKMHSVCSSPRAMPWRAASAARADLRIGEAWHPHGAPLLQGLPHWLPHEMTPSTLDIALLDPAGEQPTKCHHGIPAPWSTSAVIASVTPALQPPTLKRLSISLGSISSIAASREGRASHVSSAFRSRHFVKAAVVLDADAQRPEGTSRAASWTAVEKYSPASTSWPNHPHTSSKTVSGSRVPTDRMHQCANHV